MPTTQTTVIAVFKNLADAQAAANDLKNNGFDDDDIYLGSESGEAGNAAAQPRHEGGIKGWFKSVFGSEDDADRVSYEYAVKSGNVLLSVDTTDAHVDETADILSRHSPVDVHEDRSGGTASPGGTKNSSQAIPVIEEELRVGKRSVLRGGVRVYSRVIEEPVQESVRLREERVRVQRQPVDRPATSADLNASEEQVIEVAEYAEEPVVSKTARVVEEVRVGKDATERTETVRDTVRHTKVDVEDLNKQSSGNRAGTGDIDDDFRRHFSSSRYGAAGEQYGSFEPAYRYGYDMAADPRFAGRDFDQVEPQLRSEYSTRYPSSAWDKFKDSVRYGWDKVTGRSKSAAANR